MKLGKGVNELSLFYISYELSFVIYFLFMNSPVGKRVFSKNAR